jgi:transcriptional regulator with XRE-family HTH domain
MVKDIGLSSANMTNWKNGRLPKTEIAFKIADYLHISIYDLMGEEEQTTKKPLPENEERLKELYELTADLTEDEVNILRAFAAGLKANRKND